MTEITGRCLCGDVRFTAIGVPLWVAHCHCESCRRATASPVATFIGFRREDFSHHGMEPVAYASSPGVRRSFCGRCGTPITYEAERLPDEIHVYLNALDRPDQHKATVHVHYAERLPWFERVLRRALIAWQSRRLRRLHSRPSEFMPRV